MVNTISNVYNALQVNNLCTKEMLFSNKNYYYCCKHEFNFIFKNSDQRQVEKVVGNYMQKKI